MKNIGRIHELTCITSGWLKLWENRNVAAAKYLPPTFDCGRGWIPLLHMWFDWVPFPYHEGFSVNQSVKSFILK